MSDDKKTHPIIEEAVRLLKKRETSDTADWMSSVFYNEEAIEQLKKSLANYFGSNELPDVVRELLTLACFLDTQKNNKEASQALIEVVNSATDALEEFIRTRSKDISQTHPPERRRGQDVEPGMLIDTLERVSQYLEGRNLEIKSPKQIKEEFHLIYLNPIQILEDIKAVFDQQGKEFFETISSVNLLYHIGRLAGKFWNYRDIAETFFRIALKQDPSNSLIWKELGNILLGYYLKRDNEAEPAYLAALKYNPGDAEVWANLGYLLERQNRLNEAEKAYRKALSLDQTDIHTRSNLMELLKAKGCHQEANELLQNLLEFNFPEFKTIEIRSINFRTEIVEVGIGRRPSVVIVPTFNGMEPKDIWGDVALFIFNPYAFHKSINQTGWFEIFTCTCLVAGCDYWDRGIFVSEKDDNIIWFNVERFESTKTKLIFPKTLINKSYRELYQLMKDLVTKRNDLFYSGDWEMEDLVQEFTRKI
ncbi:MAG: tetratricopeptide repeat protein [Candidatus Hodarchaeota archaeon]